MMNKVLILLPVITGIMLVLGCGKRAETTHVNAEDSLALTILKVNDCARLYTSEIEVHKIVTFDDISRLKGSFFSHPFDIKLPLGSRKVAIPVDATLKASVDFSHFSKDNVQADTTHGKRKLIITLPDPEITVTASKVDHAGTKEYVSWLRSKFSDAELTNFTRQGMDEIIKSIPEMKIMETCRRQVANVLIPLFTRLGYNEEDIIIVFRHNLTDESLPSLTKIAN